MFSTRPFVLTTVLVILLLTGCLDTIELNVPRGLDNSLVIDAKIVKGQPSTFILNLSQIFSFTADGRGRFAARTVTLRDDSGNEMEIPAKGSGVYYYKFQDSDPVTIQFGHSYSLSIEMPDGGIFESTLETILPVPAIENLTYKIYNKEFTIEDQIKRTALCVQYAVSTKLSQPGTGEKSQIRWELEKVYKLTDTPIEYAATCLFLGEKFGSEAKTCYLTRWSAVFDILIYDGIGKNIEELENYILYDDRPDHSYAEGQYFTVYQESLSPSAYAYWEKVKSLIDRNDALYPEPVGKVESNFTHINGNEEAFGFFYLTEQDTARIYIDPELVEFPVRRCPPVKPVPDPICCDCLNVEKSELEKPDFWTN